MKFVHIAGTNGKGSVSEYIYSILMAAGYKTGCFTSPHLVSFTERMRINGRQIAAAEYDAVMAEAAEKKLAVNDTLFAQQTAAALLWFERNAVDYAVIETGLGGRLDPTNIVKPSLVVLTPIDYDHTELLGDTIEMIAQEKCGIIKPGIPVVSAPQREEAVKVIYAHCKEKDSPLRFLRPAETVSGGAEGQSFLYDGKEYSISAIGVNQPDNAALAVLAAKELGIDGASIEEGLKAAILKCRAQYIKGEPDKLLDGGHNAASISALMGTIDRYFSDREKVLLFACMKDKDYAAMTNSLKGRFSGVTVTRVDEARGADPEVLRGLFGEQLCAVEPDPAAAYAKAKEEAKKKGAILVVCGSFYLAGLVLGLIEG